MTEDPAKLADELETQADELARHGDDVGERIDATRQEWEAKRADDAVPGANPPPSDGDDPAGSGAGTDRSPAPEAPPEDESPGAAETPAEGSVGPPADSDEST